MISIIFDLLGTPPAVSYGVEHWGQTIQTLILVAVGSLIIGFIINFMENPDKVLERFIKDFSQKPKKPGKGEFFKK